MQNKGFISTIAVLLILICAFYISFSFVTKKYEKEANAYALRIAKNEDSREFKDARKAYMDSIDQEKVYLGYTYAQVKKMEMGLGLDLKGGMNLVLEVPVTDLIRSYVKNDDAKKKKVEDAFARIFDNGEFSSATKPSDEDFISKFAAQFPEGQMADLFQRKGEFLEKIDKNSSNKEVASLLVSQVERNVDDAFNVFRTRIDKFGVVSPNIQKIEGKRGQILLELPGVKDPEQMTKLLQSSANLEFYQIPDANDVSVKIAELDEKYRAANGGEGKSFQNYIMSPGGYPVIGYVRRSEKAAMDSVLQFGRDNKIIDGNFKLVWSNKPTTHQVPGRKGKEAIYELVAVENAPVLEGDAVVSANSEYDNMRGNVVNMRMSDQGAQQWAAITKKNIGKPIAIVLDEEVYSYPNVNQEISGGSSEITGNFTPEEANDLAQLLKSGKMDAKVRVVSSQVIGPSLGQEAIQSGFMSFIVAIVLLMIFMIAMYGFVPGLIANLGIILNLFFTFGILASLQAVLTLSGIAGIVLAMGMAVDANVLIFERTKEELKAGKKLQAAIADGYSNAFSAIFDGNLTSIITGVILMIFGSGVILGFATTLIIGLVLSFFTAIFLTRIAFEFLTAKGRNSKMTFTTPISRFFSSKHEFNFFAGFKPAMIIWTVLVVGCVVSFATRGMNQGIDFSGGRNYVVQFKKSVNPEKIKHELNSVFADAAKKEGLSEPVSVSVITIDNDQKVRISTNYKIDDTELKAGEDVDEEISQLLYAGLKEELTVNGKVMDYENFKVSDETNGIASIQKVGPSVADQMKRDAVFAVMIAVICMFLYILIRFRNLAFSVGAVCAVAMTAYLIVGFYSICWGMFPFSMEIDQSFIAAILTIIGYQINDTVVVFDRVREVLKNSPKGDKKQLFNHSLNATLTRTIMTSGSTLLVLLCIFILGGDVIRSFTFAMIFGVVVGTLCTIYLATPVAYWMFKQEKNHKAKKDAKLAAAIASDRLKR